MERGFDIQTGSVATGDPTMGLVTYDLRLPAGRYCCEAGALRRPTAEDAQVITLDGPYLFVRQGRSDPDPGPDPGVPLGQLRF
jgi:hypothetical protein